jgi:hypothetical protein
MLVLLLALELRTVIVETARRGLSLMSRCMETVLQAENEEQQQRQS